jgi:hypothetical protein
VALDGGEATAAAEAGIDNHEVGARANGDLKFHLYVSCHPLRN